MEILQARKEELETAFIGAQDGFYARDLPIEFSTLEKLTAGYKKAFSGSGKSEFQAKVIQKLIHKVEIGPESVKLHFMVGKSALESGLASVMPPIQRATKGRYWPSGKRVNQF